MGFAYLALIQLLLIKLRYEACFTRQTTDKVETALLQLFGENTMRILVLILFGLLWLSSGAEAACSGSGTNWSCTAGTTVAEVNATLNNAANAATLTFAAGTYNWAGQGTIALSNSKGVTLICASAGTCAVPFGGSTPNLIELVFSGTNTRFYRVSGFAFSNGGSCATCIWFYGNGTLDGFRIDHNSWTGFDNAAALVFLGSNANAGYFYGVIDHNTITANDDNMIVKILGHNINEAFTTPWRQVRGTRENVFIENNTFNIATGFSDVACMDAHQAAQMVLRYNTSTNCRGFDTHGMPHGGAMNFEIYRNNFRKTSDELTWGDMKRMILNQGSGEMYVWDNQFTPFGATVASWAIDFLYHRDQTGQGGAHGICDGTKSVDGNVAPTATYRGYPCLAQPGRQLVGGQKPWGQLAPMGFWGNYNTKNGAKVDGNFSQQGSYNHVVEGRDFYNAVSASLQTSSSSPFNGTTGIGRGTLANRPTTCTHTTAPDGDNGGGVMYWATDQGSWCNGCAEGSGALYRCSATNTWTVHYTPYTYPHPLQAGGGGGGGDTTSPIPPTNLRVQ